MKRLLFGSTSHIILENEKKIQNFTKMNIVMYKVVSREMQNLKCNLFFYYGIFALKKSLHSKFILINEPHHHFISIWKSYLSRVALSSKFIVKCNIEFRQKFVKFNNFSKNSKFSNTAKKSTYFCCISLATSPVTHPRWYTTRWYRVFRIVFFDSFHNIFPMPTCHHAKIST